MPSISLNSLFIEEILFFIFQLPQVSLIEQNKTRCYLNATLQLIHFNVLFRKLVLNINFYSMRNGLRKKVSILFIITKDHDYEGATETFW